MTSQADTYNYSAFDFAASDAVFERFLDGAPQLGAAAPPFELPDLEGRHHRLGDWRGRPVVIEFGSYTCPIFCGHIRTMDRLAAEHPEAVFVVVYTREAHPGERVPHHGSFGDKTRDALRLVEDEAVDRLVLVDDLDGTVNRAYGSAWDGLFVLDAEGTVVLRRAWNDPEGVAFALDALRSGERVMVESLDMAPPSTDRAAGLALLRGGRQALSDFYLTAPPPVRQMLETSASVEVCEVIDELVGSRR